MLLLTQDQEIKQVTQVFYKRHYIMPYRKSLIRRLTARKVLACCNLMGYDLKGRKTLLGSYDTEEEVIGAMFKLNSSTDYIKQVEVIL